MPIQTNYRVIREQDPTATDFDSSLLTSPIPPIGMEDALPEVVTDRILTKRHLIDKEEAHPLNAISGSVGNGLDVTDVGMADALNHEADSEKDPFDKHFPVQKLWRV